MGHQQETAWTPPSVFGGLLRDLTWNIFFFRCFSMKRAYSMKMIIKSIPSGNGWVFMNLTLDQLAKRLKLPEPIVTQLEGSDPVSWLFLKSTTEGKVASMVGSTRNPSLFTWEVLPTWQYALLGTSFRA